VGGIGQRLDAEGDEGQEAIIEGAPGLQFAVMIAEVAADGGQQIVARGSLRGGRLVFGPAMAL